MKNLSRPTFNLIWINFIMTIGGFMMGMDVTSIAVFLDKPYFVLYFNVAGALEQGLLVGSHPLGGLVGCVVYGMLVTKMGKLSLFRVGIGMWIFGSIIGVFARNLFVVVASRWVKGMTVGLFSILLVAYVSDIFPHSRKGKAMAFVHFSYTISVLAVYYLCILTNRLGTPMAFQIVWAAEIIPSLIFLVCTFWLPETPRWLTISGDYDKAELNQNQLAEFSNSKSLKNRIPQLNKLELASLYGDKSNTFHYLDLFRGNCWRQTLMGFTLQIMVQFTGINFLMFYIVYICDILNLKGNAKVVSASIPYLINMTLSGIPVLYLDRVKRKNLAAAGAIPLSLIMISIGVVMGIYGHSVIPDENGLKLSWTVDSQGGPIILGLCFAFVSIFSLTLSCGPWIYTNEVLPTKAKPKGFALCMFIGWLTNFMLLLLGPLMLLYLKWGVFLLFGGFTMFIIICVIVLFPETKGLDGNAIDQLYGSSGSSSAKSNFKNELHVDSGPIELKEQDSFELNNVND